MSWHAACDGMDSEAHIDLFRAQGFGDFVDCVLRLGDRHAVARNDHDFFCASQQCGRLLWVRRYNLALIFAVTTTDGLATTGTKATRDHRKEFSVHSTTHDVTQDGTT